jgi:hypothetical protein
MAPNKPDEAHQNSKAEKPKEAISDALKTSPDTEETTAPAKGQRERIKEAKATRALGIHRRAPRV